VEKIFSRCIRLVPYVDLWRAYANYVRKVKEKAPNAREVILTMYDFVVRNVGLDIGSTEIWMDYLKFLRTAEVRLSKKKTGGKSKG
jgi:cleavage stimulation factor subunit 3